MRATLTVTLLLLGVLGIFGYMYFVGSVSTAVYEDGPDAGARMMMLSKVSGLGGIISLSAGTISYILLKRRKSDALRAQGSGL